MAQNVNNTTFPNLLDLIAPYSCRGCYKPGKILCERCKNNIITHIQNLCPFCKEPTARCTCQNNPSHPSTFIISRRSSTIGTLIYDLKFHSARSAAKPLAEILSYVIPPNYQNLIVVPLPTITHHIRKRGLDHTAIISRQFVKFYKQKAEVSHLLLRINKTTQVGSSRNQRLKQAQTAYIVNPKIRISPESTYLLLDDIWTTGASMLSATKILQDSGAKNLILTTLALS